jgi:hypothetical protein
MTIDMHIFLQFNPGFPARLNGWYFISSLAASSSFFFKSVIDFKHIGLQRWDLAFTPNSVNPFLSPRQSVVSIMIFRSQAH